MNAYISSLSLKNVRCFNDIRADRIGKVTLLIGENHTGKSSFLGLVQAMSKLVSFGNLDDQQNQFNLAPFNMQGFESIARNFSEDFEVEVGIENHFLTKAWFTFSDDGNGIPFEKALKLNFPSGEHAHSLEIRRQCHTSDLWKFIGTSPKFALDVPRKAFSYSQISTWLSRHVRDGILPFAGEIPHATSNGIQVRDPAVQEKYTKFFTSLSVISTELQTNASFTPVVAVDPNVRHRESQYLPDSSLADFDDKIMREMSRAGREAKIFDDLRINRDLFGAFEFQVNIAGQFRNLIDVGYGAHSFIFLFRDLLSVNGPTIFLLQEPEVHLHPEVQALLAQYMAESEHHYIIETHSDHLIDRFRICVMDGILKPEDFNILFFEPQQNRSFTKIHSISFDKAGNTTKPPPASYRKFLAAEGERLLGI